MVTVRDEEVVEMEAVDVCGGACGKVGVKSIYGARRSEVATRVDAGVAMRVNVRWECGESRRGREVVTRVVERVTCRQVRVVERGRGDGVVQR